jgi:acyl dehydratase
MDEHFEDVVVGERRELGSYEVSAAEIREFAERYDPQPPHLGGGDPGSAVFDGLVASGWHTAAMTMRVLVDGYLADSGAVGASGVDRLRWPTPVQPGDRLRVSAEPVATEPRDGLGLVSIEVESRTDAGVVLSMVGRVLFPRRDG